MEHDLIDRHFESSYSIDKVTNKFVVRLPFKILRTSFGKACAILRKAESRRGDVIAKVYNTIFEEYLSLGQMTKICKLPNDNSIIYLTICFEGFW